MAKQSKLTAKEAEKLLFDNGFILLRIQGSHKIYANETLRVVVSSHNSKILHPKIIKRVIKAIEET